MAIAVVSECKLPLKGDRNTAQSEPTAGVTTNGGFVVAYKKVK